jgi:hypothetical protein
VVYVRRSAGTPLKRRRPVKYLLQIYPATGEFEGLSEDEQNAVVGEYLAIGESPAVIGGGQLQPVETATTVRVENGQTLLTDGPFVEAKEHPGGYYLVDADDLDAALEIAVRYPGETWQRPVAVKRRYDPTNLFRLNQNIPPG